MEKTSVVKKILSLFCSLLALAEIGCASKPISSPLVLESRCKGELMNQQKEGPWICRGPDNQILMKAEFHQGKKNGRLEMYYPNGKMESLSYWKDGVYNGPYTSYLPNGEVDVEALFVNGQMVPDKTLEILESPIDGK